MPVHKPRSSYVKVYRPGGTLYSESATSWATDRLRVKDPIIDALSIGQVAEYAVRTFLMEFGRMPNLDRTVIEIACTSTGAKATCLELPEEP